MAGNNKSDDLICCDACGTAVPSYDVVNYGSKEHGYRELCSNCFNVEVSSMLGLDRFENTRLHPVVMTDCAGKKHEFHFQMRLLGSMVTLDAFELVAGVPAGYQFQIVGTPDDEPLSLLGRLVERMRRCLSVKYLETSDLGRQIADLTACGQIEWDQLNDTQIPLLVIDGENISWDELGRMLTSFEGWQFRLTLCDRSEEV